MESFKIIGIVLLVLILAAVVSNMIATVFSFLWWAVSTPLGAILLIALVSCTAYVFLTNGKSKNS